MTPTEIKALRAERAELEGLHQDIGHALELLDGARHVTHAQSRLIAEGFAHETLGHCHRFRAEHGLY